MALISCRTYHLKACLSVNKYVANVGDSLTFTNCSDYDGAPNQNERWLFGDGSPAVYRNVAGTIQHSYKTAGEFIVYLSIGNAEQGDFKTSTITIK